MTHPLTSKFHYQGTVRVSLLALIWGSNFLWIKLSLDAFSPVQVTLVRLAMGAATLIIFVRLLKLRLPSSPTVWAHFLIAALLANALPYWLFAYGEQHVASSLAGVLNATTPLWTALFVLLLDTDDRLSRTRAGGLVLGFAGAMVLLRPWSGNSPDLLAGTLACLAAAASYGVSYAYMARYLTPRGIQPVVLACGQLLAASTLLAIVTPFAGLSPVRPTPVAAASLTILGIAGTGIAYILNYRIISDDGPSAASTVTYLLPIVSIALGIALVGEPASWNLLIGAVVVLAGVALVRRERPASSVPSGFDPADR